MCKGFMGGGGGKFCRAVKGEGEKLISKGTNWHTCFFRGGGGGRIGGLKFSRALLGVDEFACILAQ